MNLKQIEAFVQLALTGSVSAAAARLNATQPAISMRLRELERSIEADLLDRSRRTIRLTPVGRAFLDHAERIHAMTEEALAKFGAARAITGHIRLGVTETVALTWLPDLVGRINTRFPEVAVELDVNLTAGVWNRLNRGDLEVALLPGPVAGPNLECRSLGFIRYDWMASPSLNVPDQRLTPTDLAAWPIITLGREFCPCCGHREHCVLAGRGLYQCNRCKKQTSPTAGTIFHATKLPLTLWFAAIHLVVTAKNGISSVELGRRLGVKQPTAWAVKHKIMAVMARREGETRLTGRVEMDDAYLGGVRSGGKRGRGAAGKTPFVAAVSTSPEGRPRKLKLAPVKGFRKREIARGAKHWLAPGAAVVTDGLGCWSALDEAAWSRPCIARRIARFVITPTAAPSSITMRGRSVSTTTSIKWSKSAVSGT